MLKLDLKDFKSFSADLEGRYGLVNHKSYIKTFTSGHRVGINNFLDCPDEWLLYLETPEDEIGSLGVYDSVKDALDAFVEIFNHNLIREPLLRGFKE